MPCMAISYQTHHSSFSRLRLFLQSCALCNRLLRYSTIGTTYSSSSSNPSSISSNIGSMGCSLFNSTLFIRSLANATNCSFSSHFSIFSSNSVILLFSIIRFLYRFMSLFLHYLAHCSRCCHLSLLSHAFTKVSR